MNTHQQTPSRSFHGAALIDSQGREIPITEDMVRKACDRLEAGWHYPKTPTPKDGKR